MTVGRIPSVEGGIQPTIFDAKADLLTATAADTPARLAVGANDTVLTADSTTATGLKWATPAGGGKVLQVVSATTNTSTTISSTGNTDTGITATITPTANTSKIMVIISAAFYASQTSSTTQFVGGRVLRGATTILDQGATGIAGVQGASSTIGFAGCYSLTYLDSPATTSATTYKLQSRVQTGGSVEYQPGSATNSVITLLEIGA